MSEAPTPPLTIPRDAVLHAMQDAAGRAILPRFRQLDASDVAMKSGPQDIVTAADLEAEALMTEALARVWPEVPLLGEEGVSRDPAFRDRMGRETCVILDPVDGTWSFAAGLPLFAMLLAVVQGGRPVWGVNFDPLQGDWIEADPDAAHWVTARGRRRLQTALERPAADLTGYASQGLYTGARRRVALLAGEAYARVTSLRCAAHEYRMLASGQVDFMISGPVPHPWDHAAGVLSVQAAGGVMRFLDGAPYDVARREGVLVGASCEAVWQRVAEDFRALG